MKKSRSVASAAVVPILTACMMLLAPALRAQDSQNEEEAKKVFESAMEAGPVSS